jgi:valyl-tRNA synthetase
MDLDYLHWIRNIQDWCISRNCCGASDSGRGTTRMATSMSRADEAAAREQACEARREPRSSRDRRARHLVLRRVWCIRRWAGPRDTRELRTFPVVGADHRLRQSIFFGVARMIMTTDVAHRPACRFAHVYINAIVR